MEIKLQKLMQNGAGGHPRNLLATANPIRVRERSVKDVMYHRSQYGSAQGSVFKSVHMVKHSHPLRDHGELTGMDGCSRDFRKVCMANGKTRL